MFKICGICKLEKAVECFSFKNKKKGILQTICKQCNKLYQKKHFQENKDYYLSKARTFKRDQKEIFKRFKQTLKCSRCGEDDTCCLDFHHLNPGEKETSISKAIGSGWSFKKLETELNKCIVLCSNCHRKEHAKQNMAPSSSG